jgi:hypothetical protein
MAPKLPTLDPGTRAIVSGRTGSGKTSLARFLMQHRNNQHWVILNPKHTAGYKDMPDAVVLNHWDAKKFDKKINKHRFVLLNFATEELNHAFMDDVLLYLHETYDNIGFCCDELYYLHNNGEAGKGLIGILTRGRERNQTFLGLVQRPKRISLFCFSESDYAVAMALNLEGDRKRMVEATGDSTFIAPLPKYHWRWYNVDTDTSQLWAPVPLNR